MTIEESDVKLFLPRQVVDLGAPRITNLPSANALVTLCVAGARERERQPVSSLVTETLIRS